MLKKIIVSLILFLMYITGASAAEYTPSINYFPKSLVIPFGANAEPFILNFDIVNNFNQPLKLSGAEFIRANETSGQSSMLNSIDVLFLNQTGTCDTSDGKTAVMAAQGAGGLCHVTVTFNATGVQPNSGLLNPENYQLNINYVAPGQQPGIISSNDVLFKFATGQKQDNLARTFTINNLCNHPVWVGVSGSAAQSMKPSATDASGKLVPTSCQSDSDCYPGSKCVTSGNLSQCFWENPALTTHQLDAGGSATMTFPVYDNGNGFYDTNGNYIPYQITWSGGIAGRVNCTDGGCELGDCGGGTGACAPSQGFKNPITAAEFSLLKEKVLITSNDQAINNDDTYDVTIINGVVVPISMMPNNADWGGSTKPFVCGPAGGTNASAPLQNCSWNFTPPSNDYKYVAYNKTIPTSCQTDSDCNTPEFVNRHGTGMICGMAIQPGTTNMRKQCGLATPYFWTADTVCAASNDTYSAAPFYCNNVVPGARQGTYSNLYACAGVFSESCYSENANNMCCGCSNWERIFTPSQPYDQCVNINKLWEGNALPGLSWLKQGCPLAYVYPYDDKTSTFTCKKQNTDNMNITNYTITFCPR